MKYIIDAIIRGIIPFCDYERNIFNNGLSEVECISNKKYFLVGIIITLVSPSSVIYEIDHLTLTQQSIIHFFVMLITVLPCLIISGWFPFTNIFDF